MNPLKRIGLTKERVEALLNRRPALEPVKPVEDPLEKEVLTLRSQGNTYLQCAQKAGVPVTKVKAIIARHL